MEVEGSWKGRPVEGSVPEVGNGHAVIGAAPIFVEDQDRPRFVGTLAQGFAFTGFTFGGSI